MPRAQYRGQAEALLAADGWALMRDFLGSNCAPAQVRGLPERPAGSASCHSCASGVSARSAAPGAGRRGFAGCGQRLIGSASATCYAFSTTVRARPG